MTKVLIYRMHKSEMLERIASVDVPDNATTPEATGWSTFSRSQVLPEGEYAAVRAGQRFEVAQKRSLVTSPRGVMT